MDYKIQSTPSQTNFRDSGLDPLGRLTAFVAVPPRFDMAAAPGPDPDWLIALTEAGFEPGHLERIDPCVF